MKKYIAVSAAVLAIIAVAYMLQPTPPAPINGNGSVLFLENIDFIVGNETYHFENFSVNPPRIIISDTYLIVGNTIYGGLAYAMMVNQSWNLISWPTPDIIPIENVTVIYDGVLYTWQEACNGIIIAPFVFMYNGTAYVETQNFYPYFGYWLYSHHDGVVIQWETI